MSILFSVQSYAFSPSFPSFHWCFYQDNSQWTNIWFMSIFRWLRSFYPHTTHWFWSSKVPRYIVMWTEYSLKFSYHKFLDMLTKAISSDKTITVDSNLDRICRLNSQQYYFEDIYCKLDYRFWLQRFSTLNYRRVGEIVRIYYSVKIYPAWPEGQKWGFWLMFSKAVRPFWNNELS